MRLRPGVRPQQLARYIDLLLGFAEESVGLERERHLDRLEQLLWPRPPQPVAPGLGWPW